MDRERDGVGGEMEHSCILQYQGESGPQNVILLCCLSLMIKTSNNEIGQIDMEWRTETLLKLSWSRSRELDPS